MTRRLALTILLIVWATLIAGGIVAYFITRSVLLKSLDDKLMTRAQSIPELSGMTEAAAPMEEAAGDRYYSSTKLHHTIVRHPPGPAHCTEARQGRAPPPSRHCPTASLLADADAPVHAARRRRAHHRGLQQFGRATVRGAQHAGDRTGGVRRRRRDRGRLRRGRRLARAPPAASPRHCRCHRQHR